MNEIADERLSLRLRRGLLRLARATPARAADVAVKIDNFTFGPQELTVKAGTTVTWTNEDDIPHTVVSAQQLQIEGARHRRQVLVHIHDTGHLQVFLLLASAHDRDDRGGGGDRAAHAPQLIDVRHRAHIRGSKAWRTMAGDGDRDKAQRFREAALPYLDDVYTLARYLLRNPADAEDAAQECYLRALPSFRDIPRPADQAVAAGHPAQCLPRRICAARRAHGGRRADDMSTRPSNTAPLWSEAQQTPETRNPAAAAMAKPMQRLIAQLPDVFREVIVLREINDLSYREIAEVIGAPVGTVMSRLARARAHACATAWLAEEKGP